MVILVRVSSSRREDITQRGNQVVFSQTISLVFNYSEGVRGEYVNSENCG